MRQRFSFLSERTFRRKCRFIEFNGPMNNINFLSGGAMEMGFSPSKFDKNRCEIVQPQI
jgi:hypothetical protein